MNTLISRRFDLCLFDLGNTLIYYRGSRPDVMEESNGVLVQALLQEGVELDEPVFAELFSQRMNEYFAERDVSGLERTTTWVLRNTLAETGVHHLPASSLRRALDAMYAVSEAHWFLEEETPELLDTLRSQGYRMGIISNAGDADNANHLIDRYSLRGYFEQVIISAEMGIRKPCTQIFQAALDRYGVEAGRAVMIGDTLDADILGANQMGICSLWVTRRVSNPAALSARLAIDPVLQVSNLRDIPQALLG